MWQCASTVAKRHGSTGHADVRPSAQFCWIVNHWTRQALSKICFTTWTNWYGRVFVCWHHCEYFRTLFLAPYQNTHICVSIIGHKSAVRRSETTYYLNADRSVLFCTLCTVLWSIVRMLVIELEARDFGGIIVCASFGVTAVMHCFGLLAMLMYLVL